MYQMHPNDVVNAAKSALAQIDPSDQSVQIFTIGELDAIAFNVFEEVDEDEFDNGVLAVLPVIVVIDKISKTLNVFIKDETYNGYANWRLHNYMIKKSIFNHMPAWAINTSEGQSTSHGNNLKVVKKQLDLAA